MTQMKYVESPAAVSAVDCDECNIDEVTKAVACCENCSRHLCGKHSESHTKMKISSNHVVIPLALARDIAETDDDEESSSSWEDDDEESPTVRHGQNLSAKVSHVQKNVQLPSLNKQLVPLKTSLNKQLVPLKIGGIKTPLLQ